MSLRLEMNKDKDYMNMVQDLEQDQAPGGSDITLTKLRERLREKEKALENALDEKFVAVEEKENENEVHMLQLSVREKEREVERLNNLLLHIEETINISECVERHNQALSACTAELQDLRRQLSDARKPVSTATEDTPLETAKLRASLAEKDAVINEKVDDVQSEAAEGRGAHSQDKLKGEETETDEEGKRGEYSIAYLILTCVLRVLLASLN
ncbi:uncharacterized protein LOC143481982 isoform X2 [Brachyhypopomus gauderio]|uniref:uncharacterized protein LOC143481982 isoform X2 n=1 Tax=Brachyhypopomus gauderio TaxID=698409 RepID=UPI00404292FF